MSKSFILFLALTAATLYCRTLPVEFVEATGISGCWSLGNPLDCTSASFSVLGWTDEKLTDTPTCPSRSMGTPFDAGSCPATIIVVKTTVMLPIFSILASLAYFYVHWTEKSWKVRIASVIISILT